MGAASTAAMVVRTAKRDTAAKAAAAAVPGVDIAADMRVAQLEREVGSVEEEMEA